jgi:hypothetical protein
MAGVASDRARGALISRGTDGQAPCSCRDRRELHMDDGSTMAEASRMGGCPWCPRPRATTAPLQQRLFRMPDCACTLPLVSALGSVRLIGHEYSSIVFDSLFSREM